MRGRAVRRTAATAATAVAVLAAACDDGRDARPAPPTPADTPTVATTPTREAITTAAFTSRLDDPTGDVTDPEGSPPPQPVPAADLTGVELVVDGGGVITVRFELAGPPPEQVGSLLWSLRTDGTTISAQQVGPEIFGGIYDEASGDQTRVPVSVDGSTVIVTVTGRSLPERSSWTALTQLDGAYEDTTASLPHPAGAGR